MVGDSQEYKEMKYQSGAFINLKTRKITSLKIPGFYHHLKRFS